MQCPNLFDGGKPIENVVGNIDVGPTILHAAGLQAPEYMDGQSFLDLPNDRDADWRKYFLYVYYWEKNFPQTPTQFALRGDRFKYITYYGLWDTDELYDLQTDPDELNNLIHDPDYKSVAKEMENQLYAMLGDEGGMDIPMNQPRGGSNNTRWSEQGGSDAAEFIKQSEHSKRRLYPRARRFFVEAETTVFFSHCVTHQAILSVRLQTAAITRQQTCSRWRLSVGSSANNPNKRSDSPSNTSP